jgi:HEPN domain-containing protein
MNDQPINSDLEKWLKFCDEDLRAADATLKDNVFSAVCFHAQQAVEKAIKAVLLAKSGKVPRDHSVLRLAEMSDDKELFGLHKEELEFLDMFYVPTRYPDALPGSLPEGLPNKEDAEKAVVSAKKVVEFIKKRLNNSLNKIFI